MWVAEFLGASQSCRVVGQVSCLGYSRSTYFNLRWGLRPVSLIFYVVFLCSRIFICECRFSQNVHTPYSTMPFDSFFSTVCALLVAGSRVRVFNTWFYLKLSLQYHSFWLFSTGSPSSSSPFSPMAPCALCLLPFFGVSWSVSMHCRFGVCSTT